MLHWVADVDDIHAALAAAGESGPYVPVGHSYGGLLARVFAYAYPTEVQGVVSIDPAHEDQYDGPVANPDAPASCADASCPFYEDIQAVKKLNGGKVAGSLGALPLVVIAHDPSLAFWDDAAYDDYWLKLGAGHGDGILQRGARRRDGVVPRDAVHAVRARGRGRAPGRGRGQGGRPHAPGVRQGPHGPRRRLQVGRRSSRGPPTGTGATRTQATLRFG